MILCLVALASITTFFAYGDVTTLVTDKSIYADNDTMILSGSASSGDSIITVSIDPPRGKDILRNAMATSDGSFEFAGINIKSIFDRGNGLYTATAYSDSQPPATHVKLEFELQNKQIKVVGAPVLDISPISDVIIDINKPLLIQVSLVDTSFTGVTFSLLGGPQGAAIDSSGMFSWTPDVLSTQLVNIKVTSGLEQDVESFTITVKKPQTKPTEPPAAKTFVVDPSKGAQYYLDQYLSDDAYKKWFDENYPDVTIYEAVGLPKGPSAKTFVVDPSKGAQYYLDRYLNEETYKSWFDENYDVTIYEAVGLPIPTEPPMIKTFVVDPSKGAQHYVDRYLNEEIYKSWFDENYPDVTIYEAVGLSEPKVGICGSGTEFVDGSCIPIESTGGGGCLVATAAFGSELAWQVQLLREVRDDTLLSTSSGTSFIAGFNEIYYTFSPTIADWERENPIFKEIVKTAITPMISSLGIMTLASEGSELEMVTLGISVIALNLAMYIVAPAFIVFEIRKKL